jgi:hypothetical protein
MYKYVMNFFMLNNISQEVLNYDFIIISGFLYMKSIILEIL